MPRTAPGSLSLETQDREKAPLASELQLIFWPGQRARGQAARPSCWLWLSAHAFGTGLRAGTTDACRKAVFARSVAKAFPGLILGAGIPSYRVALMRSSLLSIALIAGLFLPVGAIHAQDTNSVTATCKDGTAFTGTKRSGACRGHGGVQSWGTASTATSPVNAPGPTTSQRATPATGGPGQVWVNTASKVYHCPGDRWYGKTKHGSYMSEAEARAQGVRPDHGKACTS
jgi:hypothetical protein